MVTRSSKIAISGIERTKVGTYLRWVDAKGLQHSTECMAVGLYLDTSDLPSEVSYTYEGTEYTLTPNELFSWEVRGYRFSQSYSYFYCECTSVMPIGWPTEVENWTYTLIPC